MEAGESHVYRLRREGEAASRPDIQDVFRLPSTPQTLCVGRNPAESDVFIDSKVHPALISRKHAEIYVSTDGHHIMDRSVNGTYINDIRLQPRTPHRLHDGDIVTFGHLKAGTIRPGQRSVQMGSEFRFRFEKCSKEVDVETRTDLETPTAPQVGRGAANGRQLFTPAPSPEVLLDISNRDQQSKPVPTSSTEGKGQNVHHVNDEEEDSDTEIFSIAATLQIPSDSDSDSDIFSPTKTPPPTEPQTSIDAPKSVVIATTTGRDDPVSPTAVSISPDIPVLSQGPGVEPGVSDKDSLPNVRNTKRKRRPTAGKTFTHVKRRSVKPRRTGHEDDWGPCDSFDCSRPEGDMLSWVQCDQCEAWYHVVCAGCDYDTVRQDTAGFNCGCV